MTGVIMFLLRQPLRRCHYSMSILPIFRKLSVITGISANKLVILLVTVFCLIIGAFYGYRSGHSDFTPILLPDHG